MHINSKTQLNENIRLSEYIIKRTNKNDKILTMPHSFNLFNDDTHFYWFGFKHAVIVADLYMDKSININDVLHNRKPKFFTINNNMAMFDIILFYNSRWLRDRNTALIQKATLGDKTALSKMSDINIDYWQIDMEFVKKNYKLVDTFGSTELWERIENSIDTVSE